LSAVSVAQKALETVIALESANDLGLGSGVEIPRKERLEDGPIPIVSVNVHVDDRNGRALFTKEIAAVDCL